MYDLLIKSGRVIDPAQNIDGELDIAISGDKIAKVAKDIPLRESQRVVDARDKIITPGLIDIHCHVYDSISKIGVKPDDAGVKQGVTTGDIIRGVAPFGGLIIIGLSLCIAFPQIILWLPSMMIK